MLNTTPFHYKFIALLSLTIQNALQILLSRYSFGVLKETYLKESSLLMTELMKFILSLLLGFYCTCIPMRIPFKAYASQVLKQAYLMAPVALIYYIQNYLQYYALNHLPAPMYAVIAQLKILSSALFFVLFLGKVVQPYQWKALMILAVGVALVQFAPSSSLNVSSSLKQSSPTLESNLQIDLQQMKRVQSTHDSLVSHDSNLHTTSTENDGNLESLIEKHELKASTSIEDDLDFKTRVVDTAPSDNINVIHTDPNLVGGSMRDELATHSKANPTTSPSGKKVNPSTIKGLLSGISVATLSGLAGVYFEFVLKSVKSDLFGVWERNIQLSLCSIGFAILSLIPHMDFVRSEGLFGGFSIISWMCILNMTIGGLLVGAVIKYADSILKNFASSAAIVITAVVSIYVFQNPFSLVNWLGTLMVILSIFLYSRPSKSIPKLD